MMTNDNNNNAPPNVVVVAESHRLKDWIEIQPNDDDRLDVSSKIGPLREREVFFLSTSSSPSSSRETNSTAILRLEDAAQRVLDFVISPKPHDTVIRGSSSSSSSSSTAQSSNTVQVQPRGIGILRAIRIALSTFSLLISPHTTIELARVQQAQQQAGDGVSSNDRAGRQPQEEEDDDDEETQVSGVDEDDYFYHDDVELDAGDDDSTSDDGSTDDDTSDGSTDDGASDDDKNFEVAGCGFSHTNIVWLSDDVFLSNSSTLHHQFAKSHFFNIKSLFYCYVSIDAASSDSKKPYTSHLVCAYQLCPVKAALPTASSSSVKSTTKLEGVDAFLRLLARHKQTSKFIFHVIRARDENLSSSTKLEFPASIPALEEFVSQAASPRLLSFKVNWLGHAGLGYHHYLPLTNQQWRAILRSCNKHVKIQFSGWEHDGAGNALIDSMYRNECPAKLKLLRLSAVPDGMFHGFLSALSLKSKPLVDLCITDLPLDLDEKQRLDLIFYALSQNHGLQLEIHDDQKSLSQDSWGAFWRKVVASHQTLQVIELDINLRKSQCPWTSDQHVISSVRSNKVLWSIKFKFPVLRSAMHVKVNILPTLLFNRVRSMVRAIKQEANLTQREHLFTTTMLRLCKMCTSHCNPSQLFCLLKENPDLLASYFQPREVLMKHWLETMGRLLSWEERMQNIGMEIPAHPTTPEQRMIMMNLQDDTTNEKKRKHSAMS